ncbi:MAG: sigma 54-interacting transcriptional regulator [Succinivibrionaceae bacterium]|nr:sigma 54-interacting transcriptional regulator [Succinivibrionaceae bacterium]
MQSKILVALQEKSADRSDGGKNRRWNVMVLATSKFNLKLVIKAGASGEEMFCRLNAFCLSG